MRRTFRGQQTPLPTSAYQVESRISNEDGYWKLTFDGEDDRHKVFRAESWPAQMDLYPVMLALERMTGPQGRLTTVSSVKARWQFTGTYLRFLAKRRPDLTDLHDLTAEDVTAGLDRYPIDSPSRPAVAGHMRVVITYLYEAGVVSEDCRDATRAKVIKDAKPVPGYAPAVQSLIEKAARRDVEALVARLQVGEDLLERYRADDESLNPRQVKLGTLLDEAARTGLVPPATRTKSTGISRRAFAEMLFVTSRDLTPLLILAVLLTARNIETVKELSAEHTVKDGVVLEITTTKRRQPEWNKYPSWEIGGKTRQLSTAGGFYLLLHHLMRRSRAHADSHALFCVWSQGVTRDGAVGHNAPWSRDLSNAVQDSLGWSKKQMFTEDGGPFRLNFGRLRTAVERERAKENNFDLERTALTNTSDTLYNSYLKGDPTTVDLLQDITAHVLSDLEESTLRRPPQTLTPIPERPAADPETAVETAFLTCRNILGNPDYDGVMCGASFLTCFSCPNAVVTDDNIPAILRLTEELTDLWDEMPTDVWIDRYGSTWTAIQKDILPSRTAAEIADAITRMPPSTALALLEEPDMT